MSSVEIDQNDVQVSWDLTELDFFF